MTQVASPNSSSFNDPQLSNGGYLQDTSLYTLNPFHYYRHRYLERYLACFIQHNRASYLFPEHELVQNFRLASQSAVESAITLSRRIMCEMCLVLCVGSNMQRDGCDDTTTLWYENGRRFLDQDDWSSKLWVMRVMCLISLYHNAERIETSRYYLGKYHHSPMQNISS